MTGYEGDDAAPPRFRLALEYKIVDGGFEVRLPANGIEFDEEAYQFDTVQILPYFGTGSNTYCGYTMIPDGSGSLIRFEDVKGITYNISGQVYGADYAYHEISGQHSEVMRWPVWGVVTDYGEIAPERIPLPLPKPPPPRPLPQTPKPVNRSPPLWGTWHWLPKVTLWQP